jgi:hypothetical protein
MVFVAGLALFLKQLLLPGDDDSPRGRKTVQFTLSRGEVVSNDTWVQDETRYNNLSFRESASSPPQPLDLGLQPDIDTWPWVEIALNNARLFRYADYRVLVIPPYIFVSEKRGLGTFWKPSRFTSDADSMNYLRAFAKRDDHDLFNLYQFDRLGDGGQTLFLMRVAEAQQYPQHLVYHLSQFHDWKFDRVATTNASAIAPVKNP